MRASPVAQRPEQARPRGVDERQLAPRDLRREPAASTSFRWTWTTRSRVLAGERQGSAPPISRWPVSRHQRHVGDARAPLDVLRRSRRACRRAGAPASSSAVPAAELAMRVEVVADARQPRRRRAARAATRPRRRRRAATKTSPPAAASSGAASRPHGAWPRPSAGSCSTSGTKPPTSAQAVASSRARTCAGVGRQVAERPELRGAAGRALPSRASTRSGGQLRPPAGHLAHAPRDRGAAPRRPPAARSLPAAPSSRERRSAWSALQPASKRERSDAACVRALH